MLSSYMLLLIIIVIQIEIGVSNPLELNKLCGK